MRILKKYIFVLFFIFVSSNAYTNESLGISSFIGINDLNNYLSEDDYKEIIRTSIFDQPEFRYINALSAEEGFNLKFAKRDRFPTISGNIINDESLDRNIDDTSSVRKRRDDSFDAVVEVNQTLYAGGSINAGIRAAKNRSKNKNTERQKTVSELILEANKIYLNTAISSFLLEYAQNIFNILKPFKARVDDRVKSGVMDPVDFALFSVRLNELETLIYQIKSSSEKNKDSYKVFFNKDYKKLPFPTFFIKNDVIFIDNKSYDVEMSELQFNEKKENITSVRSEYLPKFGVRARYTKYDIDDDSNEDDIRGGVFVSMPIFSFGRGSARINAAKAAAQGSKNYVNISKKDDKIYETGLLSDFGNSIVNRNIYIKSFNDTVNQRNTLFDRMEISGFAINSLAEVMLSEIRQLDILLNNESTIIDTYLSMLHQNQVLNSEFRVMLER
ncbi:MAG: TolC family protein [Alphaproteobacteria bacterium]|tara:strand:+ start:5548 stop:6879 length:1332 start_codon:yes stop_codon:yes gene_type:complete